MRKSEITNLENTITKDSKRSAIIMSFYIVIIISGVLISVV